MSKIVKAVNVMVSNTSLIKDAIKGTHETEVFLSMLENIPGQYSNRRTAHII